MTNAKIFIDNQAYEVTPGQNLLRAALSLGLDLPYFCWHPALGSVGACRLCAVKQFEDEEDSQGKLVMGCMTPAQDGSRFAIADPQAQQFRRTIIEWLMVNHPHDCPICDEGGECHLQDMTVMTGQTYRRYRFPKRTYRNQDLGPLINHEMNRCIQCYRCVRYYNDYAGSADLQAFAAHDHVYFGRHDDGVLESEFSGNLVEVCPTGVFTDKTLKQHYTRKWDLQTAPSICGQCGLGCNTIPGERYGSLRRIRNRYNGQVNGYFLCDRGRYGYEFVNSERRIRQATLVDKAQTVVQAVIGHPNGQEKVEPPQMPGRFSPRPEGEERPESRKAFVRQQLRSMLAESAGVIGIGSPRASLEANFALRRLVGPDNFYAGLSARDHHLVSRIINILQSGPARSPSLQDIEQADVVLVLGEDVTNTAPLLALALRQAVRRQPLAISRALDIPDWQDAAVREAIQQERGPFFSATPGETKLDDIATETYHAAPADIARLGLAVAHALDDAAPPLPDMGDDLQTLAKTIAQSLREAERPLVIAGPSLGSEAIIQAAANVAWALSRQAQPTALAYTLPDCNSLGLGLLSENERSLTEAVETLRQGRADTVIILENDLYRRAAPDLVESLFDQAEQVIVLDHLETATTAQADVILPAATFAEGEGTLVNNEGRAQRFYQVFVPEEDIQSSWRWLAELITLNKPERQPWATWDEVMAALAESRPIFEPILDIAPPASFRAVGQQLPRQPHRYSGRTAMAANRTIHEPRPPEDEDAPLNFSMEGYQGPPPPALIREYWSPGWNSVQALNKFQSEVGGPLHGGDPGRRLIEPAGVEQQPYFEAVPAPFTARPEEWLVVPLYHVFGSEPLSMLTPGIAELAPEPYLALNPKEADRPGVQAGDIVSLTVGGRAYRLPVKLEPALPAGVAGVPVGLPDLPTLSLPEWGQVSPVRE